MDLVERVAAAVAAVQHENALILAGLQSRGIEFNLDVATFQRTDPQASSPLPPSPEPGSSPVARRRHHRSGRRSQRTETRRSKPSYRIRARNPCARARENNRPPPPARTWTGSHGAARAPRFARLIAHAEASQYAPRREAHELVLGVARRERAARGDRARGRVDDRPRRVAPAVALAVDRRDRVKRLARGARERHRERRRSQGGGGR